MVCARNLSFLYVIDRLLYSLKINNAVFNKLFPAFMHCLRKTKSNRVLVFCVAWTANTITTSQISPVRFWRKKLRACVKLQFVDFLSRSFYYRRLQQIWKGNPTFSTHYVTSSTIHLSFNSTVKDNKARHLRIDNKAIYHYTSYIFIVTTSLL